MYKYKIKTSFISAEMLKARAKKTSFNIVIVYLDIRRKLDIILYDTRFFSMD